MFESHMFITTVLVPINYEHQGSIVHDFYNDTFLLVPLPILNASHIILKFVHLSTGRCK
jgi:hypothetical protein